MKILIFMMILLSTTLSFAKQVPLDIDASSIEWKGQKKVTDDNHVGIVKIKKGTVNIDEKNKLVGGTLIIDMTSIENKDLSGKWKEKLEAHLDSDDFFDVKNHKEASFKITKVTPTRSDLYNVTGNLTVRGVTKPETFQIKVNKDGKVMLATGTIQFDRNKYGVNYNSEKSVLKKAISIPKDKIIKDDIELKLNLKTQKI